MEKNLSNVMDLMKEYQKINHIEKQCITNCQYLYDILKKHTNMNIKVIAVLVVSVNNQEKTTNVINHMVLRVDDDDMCIIEPSYDIDSMSNVWYKNTINEYMRSFQPPMNDLNRLTECSTLHSKMTRIANNMNKGKVYCDKPYYDALSTYVDTMIANR